MKNPSTGNSRLPGRIDSADLVGILALTALCLAFFWRLAFTDLILPRGDTFAYFYPYWAYRDAALAAGKLPLWNPYLFMGAPFLANSQAGVLYPLNWPLSQLDAPTAIKAASVAHIVLAAWGMYLLSRRSLKLSILGAVFAGAIFALGGYVTSQVEHVNQLQGLAWLPWLMWLWDESLHKTLRSAPFWFALALAMQLLAGHSQTAFISIIGLAAWTAWHVFGEWWSLREEDPEQARNVRSLLKLAQPFLILAGAGIGAAGLAAAQLLPTLELTRLSNRSGGLPFIEALSFSLRPYLIGRSMLPQFTQPSLFSEYVAYTGVIALVVALSGAWAGRKDRRTLGLCVLAAVSIFLALGAYNPVYWGLVKVVPGFGLFRAPARWLALWALASAGLAGAGLDWLGAGASKEFRGARSLAFPAGVIAALIVLTFVAKMGGSEVQGASQPGIGEIAAWLGALVIAIGLIAWRARAQTPLTRYAPTALAALALVELFIASQTEPFNQLTVPEAWRGQRPAISTILAADRDSAPPPRFLSLSDILFDPGDLHEIEASYQPYLDKAQIYDYVIATKQKEILAPNLPLYWHIPAMDGFDGGILPTKDYTHFTSFFVAKDKVSPDGRLRENLKTVPNLGWLRIANVHWIITDKVFDAWLDGIYYDLQFPERRGPDPVTIAEPIVGDPAEAFVSTELGLVGHVETAAPQAAGTKIGAIELVSDGKVALEVPLVIDGGQPTAIGASGSDAPTDAGKFTADQPDLVEYRTIAKWANALNVSQVIIRIDPDFTGTVVVKGMTLIDGRTGAFSALTLSQNHCLTLANSGDVKVYHYDCALPRAYMVCNPTIAASPDQAWASVQDIPASGQTVIEDTAPTKSTCNADGASEVKISSYEPERISVSARVEGDGNYLVLSDAWYPGWEATVDGQSTPVLRANGLFRAIRVPSGDHTILFTYRSLPFEIGAIISGMCLIGLLAGLTLPLFRRNQSPTG